jgi:hypothetical protein
MIFPARPVALPGPGTPAARARPAERRAGNRPLARSLL